MTFGWYSILLLVCMVQGVVFAVLLVMRPRNRAANRLLAALLMLFVITLIPSMIGFAGAYQRYPWLTFAPFTMTLGFGPFLWLYLRRLLCGALPRRWALHLVPVVAQFLYYSYLFAQPLDWRYAFDAAWHDPVGNRIESAAALLLSLGYWTAAFGLYRRYRVWAPQHVSDSENYHLGWLRNFLCGTAIGFLAWAGFEIVDKMLRPLSYGTYFWLDVLAAILVYGFAIAGYRHADRRWPAMTPSPSSDDHPPTLAETESPEVSDTEDPTADVQWGTLASDIRDRVESERWFLDPDLTLDGLARRLRTNSWAVSRAINEGAGCNFNDFINEFRVRAVQACLQDPNDQRTLLDIALQCGFNSKTSFNRSFKKLAGETPTQCRVRLRQGTKS